MHTDPVAYGIWVWRAERRYMFSLVHEKTNVRVCQLSFVLFANHHGLMTLTVSTSSHIDAPRNLECFSVLEPPAVPIAVQFLSKYYMFETVR